MPWPALVTLPLFALLVLAVLSPARCRLAALALLAWLLRLGLASVVAGCAVLHLYPDRVSASIDVALGAIEGDVPALRLARSLGVVWLVVAGLTVLAGLPLLGQVEQVRRLIARPQDRPHDQRNTAARSPLLKDLLEDD